MATLSRGRWPSKLHELINEESGDSWSATIERIRTHPHEVMAYGEAHRQTALHTACIRYPPLHAIKAMLDVRPETARCQNKDGETPLHHAVECASEDVQKLLVEVAPEAVSMVDKYGDSPLHMAARAGATFDLLQRLCQASPQTVSVRNKKGKTPFWLLSRSYLQATSMAELEQEEGEYENDWKCAMLFLHCTLPADSQFDLAHAAAAAPSCPRDLLSFICRVCCPPQEATRYNAQGKTPLLLAASAPVMEEPKEWDEAEDGFREDVDPNENWYESDNDETNTGEDENVALHNFADTANLQTMVRDLLNDGESNTHTDSSKDSVVQILLQWNPRAASMADSDGRLPLAHAICTDKTWKGGVDRLLCAAPRALETRDVPTHLYPFQLAAVYCSDLDTVYCLTRSLPELIAMGISYTSETVAPDINEQTTKNILQKTVVNADKMEDHGEKHGLTSDSLEKYKRRRTNSTTSSSGQSD